MCFRFYNLKKRSYFVLLIADHLAATPELDVLADHQTHSVRPGDHLCSGLARHLPDSPLLRPRTLTFLTSGCENTMRQHFLSLYL
jgi:hypothetical protein